MNSGRDSGMNAQANSPANAGTGSHADSGSLIFSDSAPGTGGAAPDMGDARNTNDAAFRTGDIRNPDDARNSGDARSTGDAADSSLISRMMADADDHPPDSPDGYELSFADVEHIDEALLGSFKTTAHQLGLSVTQAQKLADLYAGHVRQGAVSYQDTQLAMLRNARRQWEAELAAQPDFEQRAAHVKRALRQFGGDEAYELMDQSMLGSHPVFFSLIANVGKALAEGRIHGSGSGGAPHSAARALYPHLK